MNTNISKISLLWVVIMMGFMAHIVTDVLPAFWGANIAMPDATGEVQTGMIFFMICISFFVPACGLLCMQYRQHKALRIANLVLASIMLLFNVFHTSELFMEFNPVQLLILPTMIVLSIYLFVFSLRALKSEK